jgi:hypothetical protein
LNFLAYKANFYVSVNGFVFLIRAALFLARAFSFLIFFYALFKGFFGLGPNFLVANLPLTPFFAFFFFSAWVVASDIVWS